MRAPGLTVAALLALGAVPLLAEGLDPPLKAFVEVVAAVRDRYLDAGAAGSPAPMQAAVGAYLGALGDPATRYLPPSEWQNLERSARGSFEGFGMVVVARDGALVVERCYPGSPAERAGLLSGDRIVATGEPPSPVEDLDELRALLARSGRQGVLLALRRGPDSLAVRVRKGQVRLPTVEDLRLVRGVHYVRVHSFSERSPAELDAALGRARGSRTVLLDLRANSGGVLDSAVHMAGLLAGPGDVTWIRDRQGGRSVRRTTLRPRLLSPPAVVLIDAGTASAAEVLAAYLRRKGSLLLGTHSYGKSSIQEVLPLADGGAAILTVARYEVAPGEPLPKDGLEPDRDVGPSQEELVFPPDPETDAPLAYALAHLLGRAPVHVHE